MQISCARNSCNSWLNTWLSRLNLHCNNIHCLEIIFQLVNFAVKSMIIKKYWCCVKIEKISWKHSWKNGWKKPNKSDGINNAIEEPILGVTLFKRILNLIIWYDLSKLTNFTVLWKKLLKLLKVKKKCYKVIKSSHVFLELDLFYKSFSSPLIAMAIMNMYSSSEFIFSKEILNYIEVLIRQIWHRKEVW